MPKHARPDAVEVFAPATVANVGPGYDVMGLALTTPGDTVKARATSTPGVRLTGISGDFELPPADDDNTACVAARLVLERLGDPFGVELELVKGLPVGSGLGSSGASAAAAAQAVNLLAGAPLSLVELVLPCARAEASACGSAHGDNVAPALLGGITLVRSLEDVLQISPGQAGLDLALAVITPRQELSTREARRAIPERIPVSEAVHNCAHLAVLVLGLIRGEVELIRRALSDQIAEPRRAPLIPGFGEVKAAALEAGALGASISGAGPSIFALCDGILRAEAAGGAMSGALDQLGRAYSLHVSAVSGVGVREVERS